MEKIRTSGTRFNPKLKIDLMGMGTLGTDVGAVESSSADTSCVEVCDTAQTTLTDKCLASNAIEWHYTLRRGIKYVRDFLDETLQLGTHCRWISETTRKVTASVELDDRCFFGPNRKQLTEFKAYLLGRKLTRKGVTLPNSERVRIDAFFT